MNPKFIDYIEDDNTVLEGKPLEVAANKQEVSFYKHEIFGGVWILKEIRTILKV